ncbi:MAG: amino acid adenylation domain-containing protein, partial [Chloroflexota bacterium]
MPSIKVIVLDCDNTLWGGVCAEDGPLRVQLDGPWRALQAFMVEQVKAGRLICLCSKNQEADVFAVFDQRPDMVLQRQHLVAWQINWQPKSESIKALANELQLGLDSFLFLDDNPLECAEVQANLPDVLTLTLPSNPQDIPHFLAHSWAFDHHQATETDQQRTKLYQQNRQREILREQSLTYGDFLAQLAVQIDIAAMQPSQVNRVAQLTQRVNQFNTTTQRRSETDIQQLIKQPDIEIATVSVQDRFGDYGLVGLLILKFQSNRLVVDTFLLSCRALGRGVEHHMLVYLAQQALDQGLPVIEIACYATARNQPIFDFLQTTSAFWDDTRSTFMVESQAAALIRFHPDSTTKSAVKNEVQTPLQNKQPVAESKVQVHYHSSQILTEIAFDLRSPQQLLQAVELFQQQQRGTYVANKFVPAKTDVEQHLAQLWTQTLHLDRVGVTDKFLALGGDSLKGVSLISQIQQQFGVALSLQDMLDYPTIAEQAALLQKASPTPEITYKDELNRANHQSPQSAPVSFGQRRLWFLNQLQPGNPAYNIFFAIRLEGTLAVDALRQAFRTIIQRHASLRTTIEDQQGSPRQIIHPASRLTVTFDNLVQQPGLVSYPTERVPLDSLPIVEVQSDAYLPYLALVEARYHFDLTNGPLFRAYLVMWHADNIQHYTLFLNLHHSISDRWSMRILFEEVSHLYHGYISRELVSLPPTGLAYNDFTRWQQQRWDRKEPDIERLRHYWQQQLKNLPTLHLPTDFSRPAIQTFEGAIHRFTLSSDLASQLRHLSRDANATLYMTLLTTFFVLLSRYTNQTDIPIGTPVANRLHPGVDHTIGFFVNSVVLRGDLSQNPTFFEVLQRVRQATLAAHQHQDLDFDHLVQLLKPERDSRYSPLFQVMFSMQNEPPLKALDLAGLTTQLLPFDPGVSQFDLSLEVIEEAQGLTAVFEYNTDLFEPDTIQRMSDYFERLLQGIANNGHQRIASYPLLSDPESLTSLQNSSPHPPPTQSVLALFEQQVRQTPNREAVIAPFEDQGSTTSGHKSLSYQTLDQQANQLAHYLQQLGPSPDTVIGLFVDRSLEMIVGILGILKAGAAYLPLDPTYPVDRLNFMLTNARVTIVVTQSELADRLLLDKAGTTIRTICLDTNLGDIEQFPLTAPSRQIQLNNLAYVMYTSGSTGYPKGVAVDHQALSWYSQTAAAMYQITQQDRVLQVSSISFDISIEEIFPALIQGATLILRTDSMFRTMAAFIEQCQQLRVTALFLPTTFWHQLALALVDDPTKLPDTLRLISFGGEKVLAERVAAWQAHLGHRVQLWNGYGPTETTVVAALYEVSSQEGWQPTLIGQAIPGTSLYILNDSLQPQPIGAPGELYIGGLGVARGYLNQPRLTADRFIPNPFPMDKGFETSEPSMINDEPVKPLIVNRKSKIVNQDRLYKTGDLVRQRADGMIEFLGRIDHQVKIRGFRVEVGEVETAIRQHPDVQGAVVIPQESLNQTLLVAYIVPTATSETGFVLKSHLQSFVKTRLPSYMLPTHFQILDRFPLTPTGKIDRTALPPLKSLEAPTRVAPRNQREAQLLSIWKEVLPVETLGVYDNFFA